MFAIVITLFVKLSYMVGWLLMIKWKPISLTQKHLNYTIRPMQARTRLPVIIIVIHAIFAGNISKIMITNG